MTEPFIPFSKPSISEAAIDEVVSVLRSGWLASGPRVAQFEQMLGDYHGGRLALCVTSATIGLELALRALDIKEGDEVITSPLTFVATLNAIVHVGAKPVLADIDPRTLNIDVNAIEAAITERTRAIMPVHFAGLPCDMDAIRALARKHKLRVIEDCAHAIGAGYKGDRVGSFGDIAVMSFHPNKNITTGEGGAIITGDEQLAEKIERLRFHGIDREVSSRFVKEDGPEYDVTLAGYKANMSDIQAALGIHQLPALSRFIDRRAKIAARYHEALAGWEELALPEAPAYAHRHAWHLFTVQLADMERDEFIAAMKQEGIGIGLHYQSAANFAYYRKTLGIKPADFPHALVAGNCIVSLPMFPGLTEPEQDRVIKALAKVLKNG